MMMADVTYRRRVQKAAVERSKFFSTNRIIERWEQLFKEIGVNVS